MASSGERRLLFDTRGKRRHVIRVVYAILALLMGASLFLVVGPVNLGELFGNSTSTGSATKALEERVERIEQRLAQNPKDAQLLLELTRAQINAGNSRLESTPGGGVSTVTLEAKRDFDAAAESWERYVKLAGDEPSATGAQLVGATFLRLAESSGTIPEAVENVAFATEAQEIAAAASPSVGTLSTLAIYQYFNGEYVAGDRTAKRAAEAVNKPEAATVENQLAEYRKNSKRFAKQKKEAAKFEREAGKESLENPFGGFGGVGGG